VDNRKGQKKNVTLETNISRARIEELNHRKGKEKLEKKKWREA